MLTAIRKSDSLKVIGYEIEKDKNEIYYCDFCDSEVIHHKSKSQVKIGHFKHQKENSSCANNQPESEHHIKTKKDIRDYLHEKHKSFNIIELEKWICNKSIRPDVYIETAKNTKIAIEVQVSQITVDQMIHRTERYYKNDIHVLWVLVWNLSKISKSEYVYNDCHYGCYNRDCNHQVKLTEMELFISSLNFNKLIFWDYHHSYGQNFYIVSLDKFIGESSEYYSESGEYIYHNGRVAKNKKIITDIRYNFHFEEFRPKTHNEFKIPFKSYSIPKRTQLSIPEI